jgi:hypothetical protein
LWLDSSKRWFNAGAKEGQEDTIATIKKIGKKVNGWNILTDNTGTYGTSYLQRAVVALGGLGANLPADAIYPTAFLDSEGKPLDSASKYVVHFEKGKLPPANAFWSITMYDNERFQVPNPIDRLRPSSFTVVEPAQTLSRWPDIGPITAQLLMNPLCGLCFRTHGRIPSARVPSAGLPNQTTIDISDQLAPSSSDQRQ